MKINNHILSIIFFFVFSSFSQAQAPLTIDNEVRLWPDNLVYYVFKHNASRETRIAIERAIKKFEQKSSIRFIRSANQPHVVIETRAPRYNPHSGRPICGAANRGQPVTRHTMWLAHTAGCYNEHVALHELMHVIGFSHCTDCNIETTLNDPQSTEDEQDSLTAADIQSLNAYYPLQNLNATKQASNNGYRPWKVRLNGTQYCLSLYHDWVDNAQGAVAPSYTARLERCTKKHVRQYWKLNADHTIHNGLLPKYCLSRKPPDNAATTYDEIVLASCHPQHSQKWFFAKQRIAQTQKKTQVFINDTLGLLNAENNAQVFVNDALDLVVVRSPLYHQYYRPLWWSNPSH